MQKLGPCLPGATGGYSYLRGKATTIRLQDDAPTGASRNCWKKLSTSVVVVKSKLRGLSTVGISTRATGLTPAARLPCSISHRSLTKNTDDDFPAKFSRY